MNSSELDLSTMAPELVERLSWLAGQPPGVAEVALSALPYGSRTALIANDVIEPVATSGDSVVAISITPHGWKVVDECARLRRDPQRDEQERREAQAALDHAYTEWQRGKSDGAGPVSRPARPRQRRRNPAQTASSLPPELSELLSWMLDQPPGTAEVALSALSYEWRRLLIVGEVIEPVATTGDAPVQIAITDYGRKVIKACFDRLHDPERDGQAQSEAQAALDAAYEDWRSRAREEPGPQSEVDPPPDVDPQPEVDPRASSGSLLGDWLSAVDATFLLAQGPSSPMHVGHVARLKGTPPDWTSLLDHIASRTALIPRTRQKVAASFVGLGPHRWEEDSAFNIEHHVHRVALPQPGTSAQLQELVATFFSQPLDRAKPLWELWLVEGLEDDGFALLCKLHYALIAGVSGVDLVSALYDLSREGAAEHRSMRTHDPRDEPNAAARPASVLHAIRSLTDAVVANFVPPWRTIAQVQGALDDVVQVSRIAFDGLLGGVPGSSVLNVHVGPARRIALVDARLQDFKLVKDAFGVTVDQVVLSVVAGALRSWMLERGLDVDHLELKVAVSGTRAAAARDDRHITQMLTPLPVHEADPLERVRYVRETMQKSTGSSSPPQFLSRTPYFFAPPQIRAQVARLSMSSRLYNLIVANVRGPSLPLYLFGRPVQTLHPIAFLSDQRALAIGVMSYNEGVYFGLVGDYDALHDIDLLADAITGALEELVGLASGRRTDQTRRRKTRRVTADS